ncbi:MAG: RNA polymerase sigma-70 factor [Longimicrobiales bacterium]
MTTEEARAGEFERMRPRLFGIAYRMTGSRADAEDAVQETWLRYATTDAPVRSVDGFLVTTLTRLCIDQLRSGRARREEYVGPWLPEPLLTSHDDPGADLERFELLSTALLRVLEHLDPLERAVFLLREVFGYPYADIAAMVERREDHCRQLAHRAKRRLRSERPGGEARVEEHGRLLEGFLRAAGAGDLAGLEALLLDDVVLLSDSGGNAPAARRPVLGRNPVARFMAGIAAKASPQARIDRVELNGLPGVLLHDLGRLQTAMSVDVRDGRIAAVFLWRNPEKLRGLEG